MRACSMPMARCCTSECGPRRERRGRAEPSPSATEAPTVAPTEAPIPAQGPLSSGPTMSTLIVGGSVILLTGGVLLLTLGSRRREPIPGR